MDMKRAQNKIKKYQGVIDICNQVGDYDTRARVLKKQNALIAKMEAEENALKAKMEAEKNDIFIVFIKYDGSDQEIWRVYDNEPAAIAETQKGEKETGSIRILPNGIVWYEVFPVSSKSRNQK